jgi:predicted amidohydrolase YtcJ
LRVLLTNVEVLGEEADSILVGKGKILSIGYEERVRMEGYGGRVIDLAGSTVIPSLHDSHTHIPVLAINSIELRGVTSLEGLRARLAKEVRSGRKFIYGRGWNERAFKERRRPTRWDIDDVTGDIPAVLVRVCGHVALLNTKALNQLLSIYGDRVKNFIGLEDGKPNGLVYEDGVEYALKLVPKPTESEIQDFIRKYATEYLSYGVTHVNVMSVDYELIHVIKKALEGIPFKVGVYITPEAAERIVSERLRDPMICGVKIFADGSFGGKTASLREPYNEGGKGMRLLSLERFKKYLQLANSLGGQLAIHAIGDGAIDDIISYSRSLDVHGHKLRIEHASLTPPDIIEGLADLGPHVVVQPHFLVSDWWLGDVIGPERARWAYAFRSLAEAGLKLYGSSDHPVEPKNPYLSISAAVSRGMLQRYSYSEALGKDQALSMYFRDPCFGENRLKEGSEANLVVLNNNLAALHGYDAGALRPLLVFSSGRIAYVSNDILSKLF